jgi:hypothetical protein
LTEALNQLKATMQERPDCLSGQRWAIVRSPDYAGPGKQKSALIFGRVIRPQDSLKDLLSRLPISELESGGSSMPISDLVKSTMIPTLGKLGAGRGAPIAVAADFTDDQIQRALEGAKKYGADLYRSLRC